MKKTIYTKPAVSVFAMEIEGLMETISVGVDETKRGKADGPQAGGEAKRFDAFDDSLPVEDFDSQL